MVLGSKRFRLKRLVLNGKEQNLKASLTATQREGIAAILSQKNLANALQESAFQRAVLRREQNMERIYLRKEYTDARAKEALLDSKGIRKIFA